MKHPYRPGCPFYHDKAITWSWEVHWTWGPTTSGNHLDWKIDFHGVGCLKWLGMPNPNTGNTVKTAHLLLLLLRTKFGLLMSTAIKRLKLAPVPHETLMTTGRVKQSGRILVELFGPVRCRGLQL